MSDISFNRYIFFQSYRSPNTRGDLRTLAQSAQGYARGLGKILSNGNGLMAASPEYTRFQVFITSYLSKLKSIASQLRQTEMAYVDKSLSQIGEIGFLSDSCQQALLAMKYGRISEDTYQGLIEAINKIKYKDHLEEFQRIVEEQKDNISAVKDNLANLKKVSPKDYEKLESDYLYKYGSYRDNYYATMENFREQIKNVLGEEIRKQKRTYLEGITKKINDAIDALPIKNIKGYITELCAEHPNETSITCSEGEAVNAIVEMIVQRAFSSVKGEGGKKIAASVLSELKANPQLLEQNKSGESHKVFKNRSSGKTITLEGALNTSRKIGNMLSKMTNAEQVLKKFFPDDEKKVQTIITTINSYKAALEECDDADSDYQKKFDEYQRNLREELKNTTHYKEFTSAKSLGNIKQLIADGIVVKPEMIKTAVIGSFQIKINKSDAAELAANRLGKEIRQNGIIPGSINLKDDVWCTFHISSNFNMDLLPEDEEEINSIIDQMDGIIDKHFKTYIEDYSKEGKGATDVQKARLLYIEKMQKVVDEFTELITNNKEMQELLEKGFDFGQNFMESISVKDYTLYNDEIGFHAGTLGSTQLNPFGEGHIKALQNIQQMYAMGGITTMDLETMEFALLNCAPAAIGGPGLKASLEAYLLGGAALMIFDEGMEDATSYLKNMSTQVEAMLPKNLNLFFLNQAYVPASYLIEGIYNNLSSFYNVEIGAEADELISRNRVIITNNAQPPSSLKGDLKTLLERTTAEAKANIDIQFIFMAGMLDIFTGLSNSFNV